MNLILQHPDFLIARGDGSREILLLVLILCYLVPVLIVMVGYMVFRILPSKTLYFHLFLVMVLVSLFCLHLIKSRLALPLVVSLRYAGLGLDTAMETVWFSWIRSFLSSLFIVVIVLPFVFFTHPVIHSLTFPGEVRVAPVKIRSTTPVVMVILDELSSNLPPGC